VAFPMDCTRAEPEFFARFLESLAKGPKPDSVAMVDTTGCLIPQAAMHVIRMIRDITGVTAEVHTHNDFDLGVSTSLAAVAAGAEVVHGSVAGIGERTGNTPLEVVATAIKTLYGVEMGIDFTKLPALGEVVTKMAGVDIPPSKPILGELAFTRESGMGLNLVKEQPLALFAIHPKFLGREARYVLGKKSGVLSVEMKLADLGMAEISDEQKKEVVQRIKKTGIEKKGLVSDDEFRQIVAEVAG